MPVNFDGHLRGAEGILGPSALSNPINYEVRLMIDSDDRQILRPFDKKESISLKQAAAVAGKSEATMRGWCEEHALGRRVGGGSWCVSKVALTMFLDGDLNALKAYHAGDRSGSIVMPYLNRFGLSNIPSLPDIAK